MVRWVKFTRLPGGETILVNVDLIRMVVPDFDKNKCFLVFGADHGDESDGVHVKATINQIWRGLLSENQEIPVPS